MPIPLGILAVAGAGAGAAGAYDLLETTLISTNTASVTFTNLGSYSGYKHLQIRAVVRTARTAFDIDEVNIRFNSDTGANYSQHRLFGYQFNGGTVESGANANYNNINFFRTSTNFSASNIFGSGVLDILDFSSTTKNKTTRALGGFMPGTGGRWEVRLSSGAYLSTNAITSITIFGDADSFVAGSRFSLYGVK